MHLIQFLAGFAVVSFTLISCGGHAVESSNNTEVAPMRGATSASVSTSRELPLPEPPATITDPGARGAYMVCHFWDALPSLTPEQKRDTALLEQTFANFANLLRYVTPADVEVAANALVGHASTDEETIRLIEFLAAKYLADPNSPMRSEDLYIPILRSFTAREVAGDVRARSEYALEVALKNRPGTPAADLDLILPSGRSASLRSLVTADTTMVVFYDPECPHCSEITAHIAEVSPRLFYRIIAIDVTADRSSLKNHDFPSSWQVAVTRRPVDDDDADGPYTFPALPSLYLLAPDGTVLLKDFSPSLLPR